MTYPNPMVIDQLRPKRRNLLVGAIVALIIATLAGAAILMQVRSWTALAVESGGACGGLYGACPQGDIPVTIISLIVGICTVPLALAMLFRKPRWFSLLIAIGLIAGGFVGEAVFDFFHGTSLSVNWSAPYDSPDTLATQGVWVQGNSVIRVRTDEVVSYDAATGAAHWTFPIPGRDVVCALSTGTAGDVGMLGYGPEDGACSQLVAIDLSTGRQLWAAQGATNESADPITSFVAAGGNTVAVAFDDHVDAYNARTGTKEWTQPAADGCDDGFIGVSAGAVVTIATCDTRYVVSNLDPATGAPRWQTPVSEPGSGYTLGLISVQPVVVDDTLSGERGTNTIRVFDAQGHQKVSFPVDTINTSDGPTALDTEPLAALGFKPQPIQWTTVSGDVLAGVSKELDGHDDLIGFSLSTGRQLWLTAMDDDVAALAPQGNQLVVIDSAQPSFTVHKVDMTTGSSSSVGVINQDAFGNDVTGLYPVDGRYVVVNSTGITPIPPMFAFGG